MTNIAIRFIRWHFIIILFAFGIVWGCATLPPIQPIRDMNSIAGKWEGAIYYSAGVSAYTLTIRQDGTWEAITPGNSPLSQRIGARRGGTGKLSEGKYQYKSEATGGTGVFILHEEGERRVLVGKSDDGQARMELTPAKN
jgi:hypothetical protein